MVRMIKRVLTAVGLVGAFATFLAGVAIVQNYPGDFSKALPVLAAMLALVGLARISVRGTGWEN